MSSDNPLPDRCAASVTEPSGLEVHDDEREEVFYAYGRLDSVVLEKGAVRAHKPAEWSEVSDYLDTGFTVAEVELEPSDGSDSDDDLVSLAVEDDDPEIRYEDRIHVGYCERFPMDNGRCYVHGGANDGAPEGNTNAMTHGLYAKRSSYYESLPDKDKAVVERLADSWIDNAPFDRDNFAKVNEVYRIAIDEFRLWESHDEFKDGLTYEQTVSGEEGEFEMEQENPANLAYDRLDRTSIRKLKELGCLDDPESQKADNIESLADKFDNLDSDDDS